MRSWRVGPVALAAVGLALVIGLTSCAAPGRRDPGVTGVEKRAYADAMSRLAQNPADGAEALRGFLARYPDSPLADEAAVRLAELALEEGREDEALAQLEFVVREHPTADRSDLARIHLVRLLRERGETERAYQVATRIRLSLLDGEQRREVHRLLADLAGELGKRSAQLRWLGRVRADQSSPEAAGEVDLEIGLVIDGMDRATLASTAEQLGRRIPAARVRLRQAQLALLERDLAGARHALERASKLPLGPGDAERLVELEAALDAPSGLGLDMGELGGGLLAGLPRFEDVEAWRMPDASLVSGTLGVVVPLTGPYAAYGEETLQGVLLAAGVLRRGQSGPGVGGGVRVVVRDTGGSPEQASRAVRELAMDAAVSALVGPLLAEASQAAGAAAEESGLPLLTLTRREEVALQGPFVLRLGATPRIEAELLADYAVGELGIARFAVLYPDDSYGLSMRDAFWDAVDVRGAEVVGVARYDVDATDFAEPIRQLVGYELLSSGERAALAERERLLKRAKRLPPEKAAELRLQAAEITAPDGGPLPPFVDFDAVFIPDAYEKAALIAAHLAFHAVRGVRLLGPSGWSHPDLISIGGNYVDGAIFTSSFHADSGYAFVSEFARRFRETFGREPTYVAAQAFDAANLVLAQWVKGHANRQAVLTGLLDTRDYPGASGITTVGPNGSAEKRPHLLGVDRGRVISIDEVGEPPYLRPRVVPGEEEAASPQAGVSSP